MKLHGVVAGATLIFGVLLVGSQPALAQDRCEYLFRANQIFNQQKIAELAPTKLSKYQSKPINQLIKLETSVDSTTGNRSESKYTITTNALGELVIQFKGNIESALPGYKLIPRDPQRPGYKNVTWTGYSNRFLAKAKNGQQIIVKIRLRKYGHVANELAIAKENFEVLSSLKEVSWLEFKIENPETEDAVVKPRVLVHDSDANLLLSENLSRADYEDIVGRMMALNQNNDPEINSKNMNAVILMVKSIRRLHKEGTKLTPESETLYERDSYKVPLKNAKTGQDYEVQMTVDKNVTVVDVETGFQAPIYKEAPVAVSVIEFKFQESLRELIAKGLLEDVPGLTAITQFNSDVEGYSIRRNEINKGKLGHLRRDIEREVEKSKKDKSKKKK